MRSSSFSRPLCFSRRDREAFERAARDLGTKTADELVGFLGEGVFEGDEAGDRDEAGLLMNRPSEADLRQAGQQELRGWLAWLDRPTRKALEPVLGRLERMSGWFGPRPLRLDSKTVQSLQAALFSPLADGLDIGLRAGFHRLARCLADRQPERLDGLLSGLPPGWARCIKAAHARLRPVEASRERAARLRRGWPGGEGP